VIDKSRRTAYVSIIRVLMHRLALTVTDQSRRVDFAGIIQVIKRRLALRKVATDQ